jgi:hypothetical protein
MASGTVPLAAAHKSRSVESLETAKTKDLAYCGVMYLLLRGFSASLFAGL